MSFDLSTHVAVACMQSGWFTLFLKCLLQNYLAMVGHSIPSIPFFLFVQGKEEEYTYHFTDSDVTELTAAVNKVKASGVSTEHQILKVRHHV